MKNTHLEHPEDSILSGDLSVLSWFLANSEMSVKMDGKPAIVWGTDPATDTKFVGTKSVFNRKKSRLHILIRRLMTFMRVRLHESFMIVSPSCLSMMGLFKVTS